MDTHLFFHNDVDGIVTAAMYIAFPLRGHAMIADDHDIILHPSQSSNRGAIFSSQIKSLVDKKNSRIVVVDYEHTPHAVLWVDHHHSDKLGPSPVINSRVLYNPNELSAARVYLNALIDDWKLERKEVNCTQLIDQVDRIDTAGYINIKEFFEDTSPIMCLSAYLETEFPSSMMFCRIVEMLSNKILNVERAMKCLEIDERYVENLRNKAQAASKTMVVYQNFSVIEQQRPNQFPRYSEYYFKPDLGYAIRITKNSGGQLYIQIGANKWSTRKNEINIGNMLNQLSYKKTGGGHFNVGGCVINAKYRDRFLDDMCINLNGDYDMKEEMEKYGVAPDDPIEQAATEMVKTGQAPNIQDARMKAQKKASVGDTLNDGDSKAAGK